MGENHRVGSNLRGQLEKVGFGREKRVSPGADLISLSR